MIVWNIISKKIETFIYFKMCIFDEYIWECIKIKNELSSRTTRTFIDVCTSVNTEVSQGENMINNSYFNSCSIKSSISCWFLGWLRYKSTSSMESSKMTIDMYKINLTWISSQHSRSHFQVCLFSFCLILLMFNRAGSTSNYVDCLDYSSSFKCTN